MFFTSILHKLDIIARVIAPKAKHKIIGIRPGEKLHEQMISEDDSNSTYEFKDYFKILSPIIPNKEKKKIIKGSFKVRENFSYRSNINKRWLSFKKLKVWIKNNPNYF